MVEIGMLRKARMIKQRWVGSGGGEGISVMITQ